MAIQVVNVTPAAQSGETGQDSEPSVAVNPTNPLQMAVSAFTNDPASSGNAPIYVSQNGGQTWALVVCVPGGNATNDISIRFGGTSGLLYAGILRRDNSNLNILRSGPFPPTALMVALINRSGADQPWVETGWAGVGGGVVADRVYVTSNDARATAQLSLNASTAAPPAGFGAPFVLDARAGGNRPSVRSCVHRSGVVYALFIGVRAGGSDVVVVRDDNWGNGNFASLLDSGDGVAGQRIVTGQTVPPIGTLLGSCRVSSRLAIAVDPRDSRRVFVAWCDGAATMTSPFTLHLRRSIDSGQTWGNDLRTITNVTNPGLAVNIRGTVALSYQRLVSPAGGNRWQTHLELSDNGFTAVGQDIMLADVADLGGTFQPTIGDYANTIAIGKDFCGVFSGFNQPIAAIFPNNVVYLRNVNWATQQLLANDGMTPVANSVDSFFYRWRAIELFDDFYVRDWTDSATSGDDGVEPSTHPVFYATSDVWNRRSTSPGTFINDQPPNEDAGNGAGTVGDNWAFARIRRRAAAAGGGAVDATAHFLVSKLGTGSNYVDASSADPNVTFTGPDPTATFNPADGGPITTAPFHWHLDPIASTHLCLAVEITAPNDGFAGQSLRGRAPGWPQQDLEILDDNNKAQRNMGLSTTEARGGESEMSMYAIIHNAATFRRTMRIRYRVDPRLRRVAKNIRVHVVGDRSAPAREDGFLVLDDMEPGENRFVRVAFVPPRGRVGDVYAVYFEELLGDAPMNGFGLGVRLGSRRDTFRHVLDRYCSVFTRLAAGWDSAAAEREAELARKARRKAEPRIWLRDLADRAEAVREALQGVTGGPDPFGVGRQLRATMNALVSRKSAESLVLLAALLERIDAALTMEQLSIGDRADVLQTVQWQADVLVASDTFSKSVFATRICTACLAFTDAWSGRGVHEADYPPLVREILPSLQRLASRIDDAGFTRLLERLRAAGDDVTRLQGAHRAALLRLERLVAMQ